MLHTGVQQYMVFWWRGIAIFGDALIEIYGRACKKQVLHTISGPRVKFYRFRVKFYTLLYFTHAGKQLHKDSPLRVKACKILHTGA